MRVIFFFWFLLVACSSCITTKAPGLCSALRRDESLKHSIKWFRESAEKKALYRQAFRAGARFVNEWVTKEKPKAMSWGVVLDIDETVLDNSWYFDECGVLPKDEAEFSHYVSLADKSRALPGAVNFTHAVHDLGGYVVLVSNRDGSYTDERGSVLPATMSNLQREGIYFDQVLLANHSNSLQPTDKNPRFDAIATGNYDAQEMVWSNILAPMRVIAFFGDNIQDFPLLQQQQIRALGGEHMVFNKFADGFFLFPNPIYGSWLKH